MDRSLGRFGDRRLEKGGPFCWSGFWKLAKPASGFGHLAAIEPVKSGLDGSCAIDA